MPSYKAPLRDFDFVLNEVIKVQDVLPGLPGYEATSTYAMFAPPKTPSAIVSRLHDEIVRVLAQPDVQQKFFNAGVETVGTSPDELVKRIHTEIAAFGKVIREAGIREE